MLELLLYASMTCQDADRIIDGIGKHEELPAFVRLELVETVKESVPGCQWDAND